MWLLHRGDPRSTRGSHGATFVPHQTTLTKLDGGAKFETHTKEHCNALRARIYDSLQFQQRAVVKSYSEGKVHLADSAYVLRLTAKL